MEAAIGPDLLPGKRRQKVNGFIVKIGPGICQPRMLDKVFIPQVRALVIDAKTGGQGVYPVILGHTDIVVGV